MDQVDELILHVNVLRVSAQTRSTQSISPVTPKKVDLKNLRVSLLLQRMLGLVTGYPQVWSTPIQFRFSFPAK
jgi:hypothetical protein